MADFDYDYSKRLQSYCSTLKVGGSNGGLVHMVPYGGALQPVLSVPTRFGSLLNISFSSIRWSYVLCQPWLEQEQEWMRKRVRKWAALSGRGHGVFALLFWLVYLALGALAFFIVFSLFDYAVGRALHGMRDGWEEGVMVEVWCEEFGSSALWSTWPCDARRVRFSSITIGGHR